MRLVDLKPEPLPIEPHRFAGGSGRYGMGLRFQCPQHAPPCWVVVWFRVPLDSFRPNEGCAARHLHDRDGSDFSELTLSPGVWCWQGWVGVVREGEVVTRLH